MRCEALLDEVFFESGDEIDVLNAELEEAVGGFLKGA